MPYFFLLRAFLFLLFPGCKQPGNLRICSSQDEAFFLKRLDGQPFAEKRKHSLSLRLDIVGLIMNGSEQDEPKIDGERKSPGSFAADECSGTTWPAKCTKRRIFCWRLGWWQRALQSIMISGLFHICNNLLWGSSVIVTAQRNKFTKHAHKIDASQIGCPCVHNFVSYFFALNHPFDSSTSCRVGNDLSRKAPRDLAQRPEIWEVNLWTIWKTPPASYPFPALFHAFEPQPRRGFRSMSCFQF